jgi:NB-ARC domain
MYFIPDAFIRQWETQPIRSKANEVSLRKVFFFPMLENLTTFPDAFSQFTCIKPPEWSSYYSSVFTLLKIFLPNVDMTSIIQQFEEKTSASSPSIHLFSDAKYSLKNTGVKEAVKKVSRTRPLWMPGKLVYVLAAILPVLGLVFFWAYNRDYLPKIIENYQPYRSDPDPLRADLEIPSENAILARPHLITMIDKGFQRQEQKIKTLALIGTGGSGKTTLARQYARLQNSPVVWEINAETKPFLFNSLLTLSYGLCKTDEEKQYLMSVTKIHDFPEKKEKFFRFLKHQLKSNPNWLLIYDNVENMIDIQKYFPVDANGWGEGRVIITTQDNHIQNNGYIKDVVWVGELSDEEKLSLFTKVMNHGDKKGFQNLHILRGFLENFLLFLWMCLRRPII